MLLRGTQLVSRGVPDHGFCGNDFCFLSAALRLASCHWPAISAVDAMYSSCAKGLIGGESFPPTSTWVELKSTLLDRLMPSNCVEESALRCYKGDEHTGVGVRDVLDGGYLDVRHFPPHR